ncbi:MAG: hypothetical protein QG671_2613 [Actinomycetota bacterium]|nr:hypothetical protein [Actinomycetota bacterium]
MDDAAIVARLVAGDVSALEHMYDEYSARLYTYARSLVPHAAEDALADTFLLANARISQLRDPSKLRPWLYAICRNECLRELRRDNKHTELDAVTMNELRTEPEQEDSDAGSWISAAYAGMNTSAVETLTLALRHDLKSGEIALVLNLSPSEAGTRLSRARKGLEESLQALVLYRTGTESCEDLRAICRDLEFDVLLRKRISNHARSCGTCGEKRRKAAALILAGPAWALVSAPASVKDSIFATVGGGASLAAPALARMAELDRTEPPFSSEGWPYPDSDGHNSVVFLAAMLGALVAVVATVAGALLLLPEQADNTGGPVVWPTVSPVPTVLSAPSGAAKPAPKASTPPPALPTATATATAPAPESDVPAEPAAEEEFFAPEPEPPAVFEPPLVEPEPPVPPAPVPVPPTSAPVPPPTIAPPPDPIPQ